MKIVVFGPERRVGALRSDVIIDLASAADAHASGSSSSFGSLLALIESGDRGLDLVRTLIDKFGQDDNPAIRVPVAQVQLQAPFPGRRLALAGENYADHVANAFTNFGQPITADEVRAKRRKGTPTGFWVVAPPVGPAAKIPVPSNAHGVFDYEGEVAIVLGKSGKRIQSERWKEHLWGTTLMIDWSIRPRVFPGAPLPFYGHKAFDSSKSIGPCIVVGEADPEACDVETLVNGKLRQKFCTREMIHSFGEILAQISSELTLVPGDVVSGGTGAGTGFDRSSPINGQVPPTNMMKPGDEVEVRSPQIGSLSARIVESD